MTAGRHGPTRRRGSLQGRRSVGGKVPLFGGRIVLRCVQSNLVLDLFRLRLGSRTLTTAICSKFGPDRCVDGLQCRLRWRVILLVVLRRCLIVVFEVLGRAILRQQVPQTRRRLCFLQVPALVVPIAVSTLLLACPSLLVLLPVAVLVLVLGSPQRPQRDGTLRSLVRCVGAVLLGMSSWPGVVTIMFCAFGCRCCCCCMWVIWRKKRDRLR